jgi:hydroxymethylbilane synthase
MRIRAVLAPLNHAPTATATSMERAFLRRTGGGCLVPIGVHATIDGTRWRLVAAIAAADGSKVVRREREGALTAAAEAIKAAEALAEEMLAAGGMALVEAFRNTSVRWA